MGFSLIDHHLWNDEHVSYIMSSFDKVHHRAMVCTSLTKDVWSFCKNQI